MNTRHVYVEIFGRGTLDEAIFATTYDFDTRLWIGSLRFSDSARSPEYKYGDTKSYFGYLTPPSKIGNECIVQGYTEWTLLCDIFKNMRGSE